MFLKYPHKACFVFVLYIASHLGTLTAAPTPQPCGLLLGSKTGEWVFTSKLAITTQKFLADHAIDNTPILAGAATIDNLVLGAMTLHQKPVVEYSRLRLGKKLDFCKSSACQTVETAIAMEPGKVSSVSNFQNGEKVELSKAKLEGAFESWPTDIPRPDLSSFKGAPVVRKAEAYQYIHFLGLDVGPEHQRIQQVQVQANKAKVVLDGSGIEFARFANYPGLLDSLFQAGAVIRNQNGLGDTVLHVPFATKRLVVKRVEQPVTPSTRFEGLVEVNQDMKKNEKVMTMNVTMLQDGRPIVYAEGFRLLGIPKEEMSK